MSLLNITKSQSARLNLTRTLAICNSRVLPVPKPQKRSIIIPTLKFNYQPKKSFTPLSFSRSLFIQAEVTPNESAMKFIPSVKIFPNDQNKTMEFMSARQAFKSPLAMKLFTVDGVKSIMFGYDFITISKLETDDPETAQIYDWSILKPQIFAILTESLSQVTSEGNMNAIISEDTDASEVIRNDLSINDEDSEVISMIKELIFTRIRPAILEDGGDVEFIKFEEETGTCYLKLRGACRTCSSSEVTLKSGIESMLKFYIEEVRNVEQLTDDDHDDHKQEASEAKTLQPVRHQTEDQFTAAAPPSL